MSPVTMERLLHSRPATAMLDRRSHFRHPPWTAAPKIATCLYRGAAAGLHVVITAPADTAAFGSTLVRVPERQIEPTAWAHWDAARRNFLQRAPAAHDPGSWHVLVIDADGCVVGTVAARFFGSEIVAAYVNAFRLAGACGPILREQCELAVIEALANSASDGRPFGEISDWVIAEGAKMARVQAMLVRAMAALAVAFDLPLCVVAANQSNGEAARWLRRGAVPLGRAGKFSLPTMVDHATGARLRLLLLDTATFHARSHTEPPAEFALLCRWASIVSAA
jgi:hypothetical protein